MNNISSCESRWSSASVVTYLLSLGKSYTVTNELPRSVFQVTTYEYNL